LFLLSKSPLSPLARRKNQKIVRAGKGNKAIALPARMKIRSTFRTPIVLNIIGHYSTGKSAGPGRVKLVFEFRYDFLSSFSFMNTVVVSGKERPALFPPNPQPHPLKLNTTPLPIAP
jgi:hypothetical protein